MAALLLLVAVLLTAFALGYSFHLLGGLATASYGFKFARWWTEGITIRPLDRD